MLFLRVFRLTTAFFIVWVYLLGYTVKNATAFAVVKNSRFFLQFVPALFFWKEKTETFCLGYFYKNNSWINSSLKSIGEISFNSLVLFLLIVVTLVLYSFAINSRLCPLK